MQLVGRVVEVLDPDRVAVCLRIVEHGGQPAGILVHPRPAIQRRLLGPVEQQPVLGLLGADPVQQQLGGHVGRGVDVLLVGRRIHPIDEAGRVAEPARFDELAPGQVVGQILAGLDVTDPPATPVRARLLVGPGHQPTGRVRYRHGQRGGPVGAGRIGVDQHRALGHRLVGDPQYRLLLPAVVGRPEPAAAAQPRNLAGRQARQLLEPSGQPVAAGQARQVLVGHRGLGRRPAVYLGGVLILQPPVRVFDLGAVKIVALVTHAGFWIAHPCTVCAGRRGFTHRGCTKHVSSGTDRAGPMSRRSIRGAGGTAGRSCTRAG